MRFSVFPGHRTCACFVRRNETFLCYSYLFMPSTKAIPLTAIEFPLSDHISSHLCLEVATRPRNLPSFALVSSKEKN